MPLALHHKICKVVSVRRQQSSCFQCYNKEIYHLSRQITRKWLTYSQGNRAFAPCVGKSRWTQWQLYLNAKIVLSSTSKENWILYITYIMGKTANVPCRHKFSVVWEKDYSKVFYLQRHETGTLLTTTNELQGRSQISANSWLAPHQDSHFLENNSENLTTSFSQQGKAVFTAMDLSIQALRAEAKKSKYQKLLSFWVYLSVCCCAHKACYLRALQHKKQALCVTLEIWQAPISAGRKHVTVVSPDRDISFTAAQPSPVPYWGLIWYLFTARSDLLMVEEEAGGNPVSLDSCWLSLLCRLGLKSWGRGDAVGSS